MKKEDLEETVQTIGKEIPISEKGEIAQTFDNLDDDIVDDATKMSKIDFNTNLSDFEITNIKIIDELIRLGLMPEEVGITRQTKRLNVSRGGAGRKDKVDIATAGVERSAGDGFSFKNLFKQRNAP